MEEQQLRKMVGRHFVVGFDGLVVNDHIRKMITQYYVGSIILFSRNIQSPQQVFQLISDLQQLAEDAGYDYPLLVSVDQENGVIRRLVNGFSQLPGAMAIGSTGQVQNAYDSYQASADELATVGIHWNLAPVADVNNNPANPVIGVRSFSDSFERAADFVAEAVKGIQSQHVAATLKHFPGHGDTAVDSHLSLPVIHHDAAYLMENELLPFKAGIATEVASVMLAHVFFPKIETAGLPASLSAKMVSLLREDLRYEGVIVTDCLEMKAIADEIGTLRATNIALANGVDIAMISHTEALQTAAIEQVLENVITDKSYLQQLVSTDQTIKGFLANYGVWTNHQMLSDELLEGKKYRHTQLAKAIYQQSDMVVKMGGKTPWKTTDKLLVISFENAIFSNVEDANHLTVPLKEIMHEKVANAVFQTFSLTESPETALAMLDNLDNYDHILFTSFNIKNEADLQGQIYRKLRQSTADVAGIALRNPYDSRWLPEIETYITPFEFTEAALRVAVAKLFV